MRSPRTTTPHGEHDFGAVEAGSARAFWTVDAYDRVLVWASPDPADPAVTARVLTLMLGEEWWGELHLASCNVKKAS